MAIQVVGGLEGKERGHTHHHRAQRWVANVEVVVREAAALRREDPVIGVLGRILPDAAPERWPLLHTLEDEIHPVVAVRWGNALNDARDLNGSNSPACWSKLNSNFRAVCRPQFA